MKIRPVIVEQGNKLKISPDKISYSDINNPIFCFKYLNRKFDIEQCTDKERKSLLKRLHLLSKMTWTEIQFADKHAMGTEKIHQTSINAGIPEHLTKDEVFYALRFDGTKPMVGYRTASIFHIVYIDRNFTLYNH